MSSMKPEPQLFSIIIPTYNRSRKIVSCLEGISRINYPHHSFEVIVVDDGSRIPVQSLIASFYKKMNLTVITQKKAGPSMARNVGAKYAKGDFLVFTDDDCMPSQYWLQKLSLRFKSSMGHVVVGRSVNFLVENIFDTVSQMPIEYLHAYYNQNPDQARFVNSNNMSLPTKDFRAVGGFDTGFSNAGGEDREFCENLRYHGYRIIYAPEVIVYHFHGLTFSSFCRQHFNYGRGAFLFRQISYLNRRRLIRLEPLNFYLKLFLYPFYNNHKKFVRRLSVLLLISQVAITFGYLMERMLNRCKPCSKTSRVSC